jgi:glutathionylspermidine synthase
MAIISDIMFTCCILHNMILEDEENVEGLEDIIPELQADDVPMERGLTFQQLVSSTIEIENSGTHYALRGDLIEHLWALNYDVSNLHALMIIGLAI